MHEAMIAAALEAYKRTVAAEGACDLEPFKVHLRDRLAQVAQSIKLEHEAEIEMMLEGDR